MNINISTTIRRLRRSRAGKALVILALAFSLLTLASAPSSAAYGAKVPVDLVEINGTAGSDQIRLYHNGTNIVVEIPPAPAITLIGVEAITINGGGGDDTLTVDFSGGNPIPSGGITYNGEGNGSVGDALILSGGSFSSAFHRPSNGTIDLNGSTITYTGLEPIVDLVPASLTIDATDMGNAITYVQGSVAANGLVAVDAFETIEFSNKTSLVLNAQFGIDHIVLNNPSVPTSLTGITVNGSEGDDVVDLLSNPAGVSVTLKGDAGDDLFKVRPSTSHPVTVNGGGHFNGDTLVVDPMGAAAVDTGSAVQVPGYQAVNYTNVETVIIQGLDPDPADVINPTDGLCTLREAIIAANTDTASGAVPGECPAGSGADTIVLSADTYNLTIAGADENAAATGDLDITEDLTILGAGQDVTIIDGGAIDRVFHIRPGAVVQISGLTIRNGDVSGNGGGIYNDYGTSTLSYCTVTGNTASGDGGGIANDGTLTLSSSTVSENTAGYDGGGICNDGTAALNDSNVIENHADDSGGGIYNGYYDTVTLSSSTVSENTAGYDGGGIFNDSGEVTLSGSTVSGNISDYDGGGIYNYDGTVTLNNSDVSGNTADEDGGGIYNEYGTMTLNNSTVSGNTADDGGGIANWGGTVTLTDSTVSGNTAEFLGGGIVSSGDVMLNNSHVLSNVAAEGGGIDNEGGTLTLNNSTVTGNTANGGYGYGDCSDGFCFYMGTGNGGGIGNWGGTVTLNNNSAVSGNIANGGDFLPVFSKTTDLEGGRSFRGSHFNSGPRLTPNNSAVTVNAANGVLGYFYMGGNGGGIYNAHGTVTLHDSTVSGNTANGGDFDEDFDQYVSSQKLNNSTAQADGFGVFVGGGNGGGIANFFFSFLYYYEGFYGDSTLTLNNSPVSGNSANGGYLDIYVGVDGSSGVFVRGGNGGGISNSSLGFPFYEEPMAAIEGGSSLTSSSLDGAATVTLNGSDVTGNSASGGEVYIDYLEGCFTADTQVLLPDGSYKRIADVQVGDAILGYDFAANRPVANVVQHTFQFETDSYLQINGLEVTESHPFAVGPDQWVTAGQLQVGHHVMGDGLTEITHVARVYESISVYNLTVAGTHNFYVSDGKDLFLVHNKILSTEGTRLNNVTITNNTPGGYGGFGARYVGGGNGGGIANTYVDFSFVTDEISGAIAGLEGSSLSGADNYGGATVELNGSDVTENTASGGEVYWDFDLVDYGFFSYYVGGGNGGGIYNASLSFPSFFFYADGMSRLEGGSSLTSSSFDGAATVTLNNNSTVSGNTANGDHVYYYDYVDFYVYMGGGNGGGIYNASLSLPSSFFYADGMPRLEGGSSLISSSLDGAATVTLNNSEVSGNTANGDNIYEIDGYGDSEVYECGGNGGGIYNAYFYLDFDFLFFGAATVTLNDSTVSGNTANGDDIYEYYGDGDFDFYECGGNGGGIANYYYYDDYYDSVGNGKTTDLEGGSNLTRSNDDGGATVMLNNSTVSENIAYGNGGGIANTFYSYYDSVGNAKTTDLEGGSSLKASNDDGAATVMLEGSTVSGNTAGGEGDYWDEPSGNGGGIYNEYGAVTLSDSTVSDNTAIGYDDGEFMGNGGGIATFSFEGETVTLTKSTVSANRADRDGGGIYNYGDMLTLSNSTVSGNSAGWDGGGIATFDGGTTQLTNVTVSSNSAGGIGGGIFHVAVPMELLNTIVAGNPSGGDCSGPIGAPDPNLDSDGSCGVTMTADPVLGPLQNNGGPTETHALLQGSPAIDTADNATCSQWPVNGVDQRGVERPQPPGGICDIGAYEAAPFIAELSVTKTDDPDPVIAGEELFYTIWVDNNGPDEARNVVVTDTLPISTTYLADTDTCTFNAGAAPDGRDQLVCDLGDILAYEYRDFEIKLRVDPGAVALEDDGTRVITNTVEVRGDESDEVPDNNTVTETTFAQDSADLTIVKVSNEGAQVRAGELFSYTIYVDNLGPSYARSVQVLDLLDSSGTFTVASITADVLGNQSTAMCAPVESSITVLDLIQSDDNGANWTDVSGYLSVFGMVLDGNLGTKYLLNVQNVTTNEPLAVKDHAFKLDPSSVPANFYTYWAGRGVDGSPGMLPWQARMWDIIHGAEPMFYLRVGAGPSYRLVDGLKLFLGLVEYLGVDGDYPRGTYEFNATIEDADGDINAMTVWMNFSHTPAQPTVPDPGPVGASGRLTISCDLGAALEPRGLVPNEGRWMIEVVVTADETQNLNNVATVTSDTPDPDTVNNRAEGFLSVTDVADLELTKAILTPPSPPFFAGNELRYRLTVTNNGPSTAENVVIEDNLPAEVEVVLVSGTGPVGAAACNAGTPGDPFDPTTCNFGSLAPSQQGTMTIRVRVKPDAVTNPVTDQKIIRNDARAFSDIFDPNNSNDLATLPTVVRARANLGLDKIAVGPSSWIAGEVRTYRYNITNDGPSVSRDVRLRDFLPDELEFVSAYTILEGSPGGVLLPCNVSSQNVLICPLGDIPPTGAPGPVVVLVNVRIKSDVPDGTVIYNNADLLTDTPDPFDAWDWTQVTVYTQADLEIEKTSEPAKVFAGEQKKYTIWVHNIGPSDALDVTVTDTLPVGLTYEIDTDSCQVTGTGPNGEQILTCTNGTLGPSGTWQFDIWARVEPAIEPGITVTNTAEVTGTTTLGDPDLDNNITTAKNLVVSSKADLKITKFGNPIGQVEAGQYLTYTIMIDNLGPGFAHDVTLYDVIQSDLTFELVSVESDRPFTCTTEPPVLVPDDLPAPFDERLEISCVLSDTLEVMTPSTSGRWMITMTVTADETQDINNVAHVVSADFDPDTSNNQAEVEHDITDVSDLEITKAAQGEVMGTDGTVTLEDNEITAGLTMTYTLKVTNHGPSTAENVVVQDRLPPWIVVTDADASQGMCSTGTPGEPLDKLTCGLGTLAPDASATITITADVPSWVPEGTILENDALVYSGVFDDNNANDFAHNLTDVNTVADLSVTKIGNPDPVVAGELLEYTVTVTNTGPSDAIGVVISDTLPAAVEFVEIRDLYAIGVVCSLSPIDEHTLTCVLGDIPAGGVWRFAIVVLVAPDAPGALLNLISVIGETSDPSLDNNFGDEGTVVDREQELFVTKSDSPDPVLAGTELRYTITFGNNGPSEATNVVISDTLPLGVIFGRCESLDPNDQVTCSFAPGSGDGNLTPQIVRVDEILEGNTPVYTHTGNIAVGDSFTFLLIAKVESGYVLDGRGDTGTGQVCKPFFDASSYPYFAHNRADISGDLLEGGVPTGEKATAHDDECTRVNAEADLELTKTDTPDPVSNGFVFSYTITVRNNGPSDSAVVLLTDILPVDVEFLEVDDSADDLECIFRDDGTVFCLVGNDPDNTPTNQRGRLNASREISFTITVRVDEDSSSRTLVNQAEVQAVSDGDARVFFSDPGPDVYPDDAIPTADPDPSNNADVETTTVLNARIRVDKKAFLGDTAGLSDAEIQAKCETDAVDDLLVLPDTEVTYCYFIYSEGDTWLNEVELTDAPSGHVETASGPFVNIIGRAGTNSDFTTGHALWASVEGELAPLAPAGGVHPDGYTYLLATRTVTVDFPAGTFDLDDTPIILGSNTATVTAVGTTKYSTTYPGVTVASDTDLLHDTLALPVLEETTKEWDIFEDNGDGLPSPDDVIEYVVDIPNTGAVEATGVVFTDTLYNWISDDAEDLEVPGVLINGSVSAAIHVYGRDPVTGRVIDADVQPPDLALGEDLLLRTRAPGIELTYPSAVVLPEEVVLGNNSGDDEVQVATRLAIPPVGYLLRFDGVTYDPPIPVTFSLRIKYQVQIKETKYVRLGTIVLNHGWLTYNEMGLFDQRYPDFDPANPNTHTAANKVANNHNGTPGRAWESPEFPGWPEIPVDVEPTNYLGDRFDDYAQPGAALRDDDDPTWFKLVREPRRIQLPAIDNEDGWETQIQVQNGGDDDTVAIVFFWGAYSGKCPYSDPGPVASDCMRVFENGVWSMEPQDVPSIARSAIVYSVDKDLFREACRDAADAVDDSAAWEDWKDDYEGTGEPIAVIVQREGPNDHGTLVSSVYPGISENNVGGGPPYRYFAPYAMRQYQNLDTEIIIHNSGQTCTEVWLDYQKQDDCIFSHSEHISKLAPGESIRRRVPEVLGADWLGSIYIRANEPLGIVMDQTSFLPSEDRGALLTYEARPYRLTTDTVFYADLIWREVSGWDASIQVQNLTQHSLPTFVTVEFFDQSGDSILVLGDWVCRAGSTTFYLPVITDLGMEYAGAAVIQSHGQVDYPGGDHPDGEPIFAVVDLKKRMMWDADLQRWRPTVPGEIQGGAYNALAEGEKKKEKEEASDVMLPFLAKGRDDEGVTSLIAVRNNSNCNEIVLKLEVREGTGTVVSYVHLFGLSPGHIKLIDLANVGSVNPGFIGAGTVRVIDVDQLCDTDHDGRMDQEPTMLSVVVVNKGAGSGDVTSVYEGIPVR